MARSTAAATNVNGDGTESVLGRGTRVRGRIRGDGDLRIEGAVEGEVAISGDLAIEEGATIKGDVQASTVTIGGSPGESAGCSVHVSCGRSCQTESRKTETGV